MNEDQAMAQADGMQDVSAEQPSPADQLRASLERWLSAEADLKATTEEAARLREEVRSREGRIRDLIAQVLGESATGRIQVGDHLFTIRNRPGKPQTWDVEDVL